MDHPGTPGTITPFGIVLMDEPEGVGVTTFADTGDVLLTINARKGGNCGQILLGLSAAQTLQLIERLQANAEHCRRAIAAGRGGSSWPEAAPERSSGH